MKVARVDVYLVRAGNLHPVIVEVVLDNGLVGIGEAAIAYGVGGTAAAGMVKDLAERFIVGRDPSQIEKLWCEMYDQSFWAKNGGAMVFAAMSGIEQALWDLKGKRLGVPVYEMLGGLVHERLRVYANGWYGAAKSPDDLARATERPLRDGYRALKFYPLGDMTDKGMRHVSHRSVDREFFELAVSRVKAVRDAVGPDVEIMVDLSGGLTTDETLRFCRRVEPYDLTWIEEPCDPFDAGALRKISEQARIPIAAGERAYSRQGFRRLLEPQSVDILQPDVGNTGGIFEARKIAAMAEAYNMRIAPHNCGSMLMTAASMQLGACIPNFMTLEIYPYFPERPGYVHVLETQPEAKIRGGFIDVPTEPGLGAALHRARIDPFRFARCEA
jgi:galactonate dehydratase